MIDKSVLSKLNERLELARTRTGLMAIFMVEVNSKGGLAYTYQTTSAACTGDFNRQPALFLPKAGVTKYLAVAYNGESPKDQGSGGLTGLMSCPSSTFEGGDVSKAWLKFLLDPTGIWKEVIPYIANADDLDDINYRTGFIFRDPHELPAEATFNFLIASRFAQEQNRKAIVWYDLVQKGVNPRIAFIYATWYGPKGGCLMTPSHSIGLSPPKVWAKNFYLGKPFESVTTGGISTENKPSLISTWDRGATVGVAYGLKGAIGENMWLCHKKTPPARVHEGFFNDMKPATVMTILEQIELFVTAEGE